jgi:hypothetical protein
MQRILLPSLLRLFKQGQGVVVSKGDFAAVSGKLTSYATSKAMSTMMVGGRNVTAKRIPNSLVKPGEVWIVKSNRPRSVYQTMRRAGLLPADGAFGIADAGNANAVTVIGSRAPITFGSVMRLVILNQNENEKLLYKLSDDTIAISPVTAYMDFGDFDGDPYYLTFLGKGAEGVTHPDNYRNFTVTYNKVIKHLTDVAGKSPFTGSDYIGEESTPSV